MHRILKCLVVGPSGAGKSNLRSRFEDNEFIEPAPHPHFDRSLSFIEVDGVTVFLNIMDVIATDEYAPLRTLWYVGSEVVLVCFAIDDPSSIGSLTTEWIPEVKAHIKNVPTVLVGTKADLRSDPRALERLRMRGEAPTTFTQGTRIAEKIGAVAYMLSRAKPAVAPANPVPATDVLEAKKKVPKLETFISGRDYVGAVTLLEFLKASGKGDVDSMLWLGYSFFHLGDYRKAMEAGVRLEAITYQVMLLDPSCDPLVHLYLACCYFFLGMYKEADDEAQRGPTCKLQNRLLFHLSHKFNDEKRLMGYHQNLQDVIEDQLSLASIHYLRSHYQEAIDIYKRILLENRDFLAINVYVAMCYYKLDYYDVSQEVLSVYLQHYTDSVIATNLKACNHFRLYNGKAAEAELKSLSEKMSHNFRFAEDLIRHNLVVFRNGEGALQVFPPLLDVIPEARLNLVIYHLRNDDIVSAFNLMKDVEPSTPQEYILKGIVNASLGQEQESREHLKIAQQYFQLVGGSASECDTIPGRQCMASCFFLLKQFEDVLIYLNSIKARRLPLPSWGYFYNDDTFNYNYAQAKVATGAYEEGEEILLMIQNEKFKNEYAYLSHLARCYIMNKKPRLAWELYLKMETSSESFSLLQLIANDCYKMGQYYYSAKAFDVLERLDPNPEFWEGKRGACVGVFKQIVAGEESKESFRDIIAMLRNTSNPQVEYIIRVMKKYAKENRIAI